MNPDADNNATSISHASDRELVITRGFDAPAAIVFEAWSQPELFRQWWTPKSFGMTIVSCEMDVRTGGSYRLEIGHPASDLPMPFSAGIWKSCRASAWSGPMRKTGKGRSLR